MEVEFINSSARMTAVKTDKAKKIDGKNSRGGSSYNGFYTFSEKESASQSEYFIKVPKKETEFFFEALAARIIARFKEKNILPQGYHELFVTAEPVTMVDGGKTTRALASRKANVTELFKLFFPWEEHSIRSNKLEKFTNKYLYQLIPSFKSANSELSMVIFISLLLGDYSVHSGNIFGIKQESDDKLCLGKLDFGAAFRDFMSNKSLLKPYEYEASPHKKLYKDYLEYYLRIPGFKESLETVRQTFTPDSIVKMKECFNEAFADCYKFFDLEHNQEMRQALSKYSGINFEEQEKRQEQFKSIIDARMSQPLVLPRSESGTKTDQNDNIGARSDNQVNLFDAKKNKSIDKNLWEILKNTYDKRAPEQEFAMKELFTSLMKLYAHMLGKNASKEIVHDKGLRAEKYKILNSLIEKISGILGNVENFSLQSSTYKEVMKQFKAIEQNGGFAVLNIHSSARMALLRDFVHVILCPILLFIPLIFPGLAKAVDNALGLAPTSAVLFDQAKNIFQQTAEAEVKSISIV